jgi:hypothetical protein
MIAKRTFRHKSRGWAYVDTNARPPQDSRWHGSRQRTIKLKGSSRWQLMLKDNGCSDNRLGNNRNIDGAIGG